MIPKKASRSILHCDPETLEFLAKFGVAADVALCKQLRKIRRGKGKMRNCRYVMRRGPLVVYVLLGGRLREGVPQPPWC